MSIQNEINRLSTAKNNLKNELSKLDITIPDSTKIDSYPQYVANYIVEFDKRLAALEENARRGLYFENSVASLSEDATVEEKLAFYEEKSKYQIYISE